MPSHKMGPTESSCFKKNIKQHADYLLKNEFCQLKMKLCLKFSESTLEKARIFLTTAKRRLDIIHRRNWSAQFLRNAHCGFTEKICCSAKTFTFPAGTNFRGLPSRITNNRTLVCVNFVMCCFS